MTCPGEQSLNAAKQCGTFSCVDETSCNNNGKCNDAKDRCVCNTDFAGTDCKLDLSSKSIS